MKVVNLTPHAINVLAVDGETMLEYPASGAVARVEENPGKELTKYPFAARKPSYYGEVVGLPLQDWVDNSVVYIVTPDVAAAVPDRDDVFCSGEEIRDEDGGFIGIKYLKRARVGWE